MQKKGWKLIAAAVAVACALSIGMTAFAAEENTAALSGAESGPALSNEWVNALYTYLVTDNYKAVMKHVREITNVRAICAGYEYAGWPRGWETAYRLKAGDGRVFWIVVAEEIKDVFIDAPLTVAGRENMPYIYVILSDTPGNQITNIAPGDRYVWLWKDKFNPMEVYAYTTAGTQLIAHEKYSVVSADIANSATQVKVWNPVNTAKRRLIRKNEYGEMAGGDSYEYAYDSFGNVVKYVKYRRGSVQEWEEWSYDSFGNMVKHVRNATSMQEYVYDERGRLKKEVGYMTDKSVGSLFAYYYFELSYDDRGNPKKMTRYERNDSASSWTEAYWTEYKYNDCGNLIWHGGLEGVGPLRGSLMKEQVNHRYEYDDRGNLTGYTVDVDGGGALVLPHYTYSYDSQGNKIKSVGYSLDGSVGSQEEYSYDSFGNLIKYVDIVGGSVSRQKEYSYDSFGNLIKEVWYNGRGVTENIGEYSYDSYGNVIKFAKDGSKGSGLFSTYWKEYSYDSLGNWTKEISYKSDGSVNYKAEYSYDSQGNLLKLSGYNGDGTPVWGRYASTSDEMTVTADRGKDKGVILAGIEFIYE